MQKIKEQYQELVNTVEQTQAALAECRNNQAPASNNGAQITQAQYGAVVAEKDGLLKNVTSLTSENSRLSKDVTTLTSEKAGLSTEVANLNDQVTTLTSEKDGLSTEVASLTAQNAAFKAVLEVYGTDTRVVVDRKDCVKYTYTKEQHSSICAHQDMFSIGEDLPGNVTSFCGHAANGIEYTYC